MKYVCILTQKRSVKATISNPDNGMHAIMCGNTTYQAICVYVHAIDNMLSCLLWSLEFY